MTFPRLKALYEGADVGGMDWAIVRTEELDRLAVRREGLVMLGTLRTAEGKDKPNRYSSRTAALRASKAIAKKADAECSELGSWGGWKGAFRIPGAAKGTKPIRQFQLCIPIPRLGGDSESDSEDSQDKPAKPLTAAGKKLQAAKSSIAPNPRRKPLTEEEKAAKAAILAQSPAEIKRLEEDQRKQAALAASAS